MHQIEVKSIKKLIGFTFQVPYRVLLLALVHGLDHFNSVAFPVLFILIREDLALTYTQLGVLVSLRGFSGILQPLAGYLCDRFGAKGFLIGSCLLMGLSFIGLSFSNSFFILLFFQFFQALGSVPIHPASYPLVARLRGEQPLGRRMAFHTMGGILGITVGFPIIASLGLLLGWRYTLAFLSIPCLLVSFLLLRTSYPTAMDSLEKDPKRERVQEGNQREVVIPILIIGLSGTFRGMFSRSLNSFLPTFISTIYGSGIAAAGFLSSLLYAGELFGLIIGGEISHRTNRIHLIFYVSLITMVLLLLMALFVFPNYQLVLLLLLIGFAMSLSLPAKNTLISEISPVNAQGRVFGLNFGLSFIGGAIISPVAGYLADTTGMQFTFILISILSLLMGLTILFLKKWGYGRVLEKDISPST